MCNSLGVFKVPSSPPLRLGVHSTSLVCKSITRNSYPEVLFKKAALKNFATFTRKYLCWSLFFNKVV